MIIAIKNLFAFHLNGALHTLTQAQCIYTFAEKKAGPIDRWHTECCLSTHNFLPFTHTHTISLAARKIFQLSKYSYRVLLGRKCACLRIFATRAIIQ